MKPYRFEPYVSDSEEEAGREEEEAGREDGGVKKLKTLVAC